MLVSSKVRDSMIDRFGAFVWHIQTKAPSGTISPCAAVGSQPPYPAAVTRSSMPPASRRAPTLQGVPAYVCIVEVRLHINESGSLKSKRKVISSLKAQIKQRFGASVAEVDGQDTWQRSTIVCALVGGAADVGDRADGLERFVESRVPEGCSFERDLLSLEDIRG